MKNNFLKGKNIKNRFLAVSMASLILASSFPANTLAYVPMNTAMDAITQATENDENILKELTKDANSQVLVIRDGSFTYKLKVFVNKYVNFVEGIVDETDTVNGVYGSVAMIWGQFKGENKGLKKYGGKTFGEIKAMPKPDDIIVMGGQKDEIPNKVHKKILEFIATEEAKEGKAEREKKNELARSLYKYRYRYVYKDTKVWDGVTLSQFLESYDKARAVLEKSNPSDSEISERIRDLETKYNAIKAAPFSDAKFKELVSQAEEKINNKDHYTLSTMAELQRVLAEVKNDYNAGKIKNLLEMNKVEEKLQKSLDQLVTKEESKRRFTINGEILQYGNESEKSMANQFMDPSILLIEEDNAKIYEVTFKKGTFEGITAEVEGLKYDRENGSWQNASLVNTINDTRTFRLIMLKSEKDKIHIKTLAYMGGPELAEQDAVLKLNLSTKRPEGSQLEDGNKQKLKEFIDSIQELNKDINEGLYKEPKSTEFKNKYIEATKLLEANQVTDDAIDAIIRAIRIIKQDLVLKAVDEFAQKLGKAEGLANEKSNENKYTEQSFSKLKVAVEAGNAVWGNRYNQSKDELERLINLLDTAMADLREKGQEEEEEHSTKDGIYTAPVEVAHAYNPGQKSMANNAIEHTAKVVYRGDKVTVELTFKGMPLMGMKGHLTNLFFYRDNKDPKDNNDVIEAEVIKTHMDDGLDGKEHNYPQIFRYTMDKSVFEASDFLWIKVWVDAMDTIAGGGPGSGAQNAKIVIDKTNFTKVVLNTQDLSNAIAAAKEIVKGKKTDEAFSKLKEAIAATEETLKTATDQEALNQGVATLKAAVETFNNSSDKEVNSELVKYVKLNVEDGGPTDPKIRNILDDYAEIVKINEKTYLRLTYFSLEKRSNGLDYGTKQLKYSYDESGEKIEATGKVIESGQNAGEYELSQIDIPIDGKSEVYLFGEFMASIYNNNKIPGKAIVRFEDSDRNEKILGSIDEYIVSQKGFTQKEGTEKLEFDVEKDGKIYTPYTSLEKGKFKIINHGSGEISIKIKRNSFLLGDLRHIKYTLDGTEPTSDSKEAGLRNENKPAIGFDKYYVIYLPYEDVESLKETGGDIKVRFKGFNKDCTQSTESKEITVSFSKEAYDELEAVKDETNNISFKADSSREYCFNSTTTLKVENIKDSELSETFNKLAEDKGVSDATAYKLSFVDNNETAKLDIDKSWDSEKFPLIKIKVEKEGADRNYYKNTVFYEVKNGKLVQIPYNYMTKKASIKNPESIYVVGQKNYDTQLQEAKEALQEKMNQIETNVTGNSLAEINLKNLLEKAKNASRLSLDNILALNYQMDRNFELINEGKNSDIEINKELAKELVKCINSDIYKEIFAKDFYNQVVEVKKELENKLQSGADLKDDLLKLDNLFKDPKYALPYKVTSVEIKRQDRDNPSMAGGCFMEEGKILYGKDENYLLLNLKTMSPGFLNAHLLELSVFKDRIDEDKLDVMSIYKYSDVMSGTSKLGIFDKQILVKLPKIEKDTYFIRVANDGMQGAAPGARLKFTAKGDLIEDEPQAPLQKEALTKEIEAAKEIAQGKKTEEAFAKLKAEITSAEEALNSASEQTAIDEAVTTLKAAIEDFNNSPDVLEKEALTKEIEAAKEITQGKKTEEAFNTLKAAITTAEKVLSEATDQTQLDEAVKTLKAAVKAFNESADKVVPDPLEKEALTKEIAEAKKVEQGKKTEEAFNTLKAAITTAEKVLGEATEQTQLDEAVKTLKAAVKAFKESADKEVAPQPQPQPKPEPKPSYPNYPIYPWYNNSTKVTTSKTNKNTEIKKQEVKEESLNQGRFTDTNGHWAKEAIDYVVEKGYFAGVSATEFAPNRAITRGQLVTVLGRILNIDKTSFKSNNFKDVKSDAYYAPYIAWAESVGIAKGRGNGNFDPDKEITREEMAVMMVKFLKISGKNINAKVNEASFKDEKNIESWAKDAVVEMAKLGLVNGMADGSFSPKTEFTRAQVAQILYNIDKN